jgi:hypothetical protein
MRRVGEAVIEHRLLDLVAHPVRVRLLRPRQPVDESVGAVELKVPAEAGERRAITVPSTVAAREDAMPFKSQRAKLVLEKDTRDRLRALSVSSTAPAAHVERAKILLALESGDSISAIDRDMKTAGRR